MILNVSFVINGKRNYIDTKIQFALLGSTESPHLTDLQKRKPSKVYLSKGKTNKERVKNETRKFNTEFSEIDKQKSEFNSFLSPAPAPKNKGRRKLKR